MILLYYYIIGSYGAFNDKTIVKYDGFINKIKNNTLFTNYTYPLVNNNNNNNEIEMNKGAYVIVDSGYIHIIYY